MKKVNTEKYTALILSLERMINSLITMFAYDGHRFVVLYGKGFGRQDYVQTILEDDTLAEQSSYLIEA